MNDHAYLRTKQAYEATTERYRQRWATSDPLTEAKRRFAARLRSGATILDVGCGPGRDLAWFARAGLRPIGLDVVHAMVASCSADLPLVVADSRRLPLAAASIDAWWASASLLHLPATELPVALAELRRVSRPGAAGFLAVKRGEGDEFEPVGEGPHARYFQYWQPAELDAVLIAAGLDIIDSEIVEDSLGRRDWLHRTLRCP